MTNTDLSSLITKLEGAEGPSRELDLAIAQAVDAPWSYFGEPPLIVRCAKFTGKLDAAIPGEDIERSCRDSKGEWSAWDARGDFVGYGKTEPLARRIASLRAKLSEAQP